MKIMQRHYQGDKTIAPEVAISSAISAESIMTQRSTG